MPSKTPSTTNGPTPAKSGAAAKSAKPAKSTGKGGKVGKGRATIRKFVSVRKTAITRGAGDREGRGAGPFSRTDARPGMITRRITVRDQTTIPPVVRELLGLTGGGELGYVIDQEGVRLVNPQAVGEHVDPVLQQFLALLGHHIAAGPAVGGAVAFPAALLEHARALTADVEIDHDAPLEGAMRL